MFTRRSLLTGLAAAGAAIALPQAPARAQVFTSKAKRQAVRLSARELYHSPYAIVAANPDAKLSIAEFFDYNCHVCREFSHNLFNLARDDSNLRIVLREFPVFGPDSQFASQAALAARKQDKYLDLHLALMDSRGRVGRFNVMDIAREAGLDPDRLAADMKDGAVNAAIAESYMLANILAVPGTPTYVVDDFIVGGAPQDVLAGMVEAVRSTRCYTCQS